MQQVTLQMYDQLFMLKHSNSGLKFLNQIFLEILFISQMENINTSVKKL